MNRKRCPWCGKKIDKSKGKISWHGSFLEEVAPFFLRQTNCVHCSHKYARIPVKRYILGLTLFILFGGYLGFFVSTYGLFIFLIFPPILWLWKSYAKVDDRGKLFDANKELLCEIIVLEKYGKINCEDLYFLENDFDNFEPFVLASPISVYYSSKKSNTAYGEFLYKHEKNYHYIGQESCLLYDTSMNLVAKIKLCESKQNSCQ